MTVKNRYLDSSLKKIVRGAGIVFFGTLIGIPIGYLSRLIIARGLESRNNSRSKDLDNQIR